MHGRQIENQGLAAGSQYENSHEISASDQTGRDTNDVDTNSDLNEVGVVLDFDAGGGA